MARVLASQRSDCNPECLNRSILVCPKALLIPWPFLPSLTIVRHTCWSLLHSSAKCAAAVTPAIDSEDEKGKPRWRRTRGGGGRGVDEEEMGSETFWAFLALARPFFFFGRWTAFFAQSLLPPPRPAPPFIMMRPFENKSIFLALCSYWQAGRQAGIGFCRFSCRFGIRVKRLCYYKFGLASFVYVVYGA